MDAYALSHHELGSYGLSHILLLLLLGVCALSLAFRATTAAVDLSRHVCCMGGGERVRGTFDA